MREKYKDELNESQANRQLVYQSHKILYAECKLLYCKVECDRMVNCSYSQHFILSRDPKWP